MKQKVIQELYKLNKDFYQKTANYFSNSRQYYWQGWNKCLKYIKKGDSILDIGCGNGRFVSFLDKHIEQYKYLGIDNSSQLLKIARNNHPEADFKQLDLQDLISTQLENKFDLITMFGILHHIPSFEERKRVLQEISDLLTMKGTLILTVWRFAKFSRFKEKIINLKEVNLSEFDLEENDYLLDWRRGESAIRYCHYTDVEEMHKLIATTQLQKIDTFLADGKNDQLNRYWVIKQGKP